MAIHIKVPGSAGELIQGTLDGEPFLVTCPIDVFTDVYVTNKQESLLKEKSQAALSKTLQYLNLPTFSQGLRLVSELPQGKGMASSSADIAAVCQAVAIATGRQPLTEAIIAKIAASIEPTDGVFCKGIVCINHLDGVIKKQWQKNLPLALLLFDLGGSVDTLCFNSRSDLAALNKGKEAAMHEAVRLLELGLETDDFSKIGQAATISAFANQTILPKPHLDKLHAIAMAHGALGINIAHSGTIVGMIFLESELFYQSANCIAAVKKFCPAVSFLNQARIISGGIFEMERIL